MKIDKVETYWQGDRREMLKYVPANSRRILEVGCGEGGFAKLISNKDREIWGVEPHTSAAQKAERHLFRVLPGTIESRICDLPNDYFDLIIFNDVLEHLIDPAEILVKVKMKLAESGSVLASIPNLRFAKVTYNLLFNNDFTYTEFGILDSTHLRFFTIKTIRDLFHSSGYIIEFMEGIDKSPSTLALAYSLFFSLLTISNCSDMLYTGFAVLAKKESER
jgi:2-polyprenyl-3-methyl-5-hydroxy-6-metoxy-1,4-benzoquinol methylase